MSLKHVVVQGAEVKCQFSVEPKTDKIKVLSHKNTYANDKSGEEKLYATTKEIGQTLEKNTFGKCKLQPNGSGDFLPCMACINKWSKFYKNVTLPNGGHVLTEDSKGTCPIGGVDCISIEKHGQKAEPSKQDTRGSDDTKMAMVSPIAENKKLKEEVEQKAGLLIE
jgi:hypothetical protein